MWPEIKVLQVLQKTNLQILLTSHVHCHADEILKVAVKKLCLHLWVGFLNVSSQWCFPEELIKLQLSLA